MIDLGLMDDRSHECDYCDAETAGSKVIILTDAQADLLHDVLKQIREAAEAGHLGMSAAEQSDLQDMIELTQPRTVSTGGIYRRKEDD